MDIKKSIRKKFSYTKIDIEGIFIILQMLDGKNYTVNDLIENLSKFIGEKKQIKDITYNKLILANSLGDYVEKCTPGSVGRSLKKLKKYDIVEKNEKVTLIRGGNPWEWRLLPQLNTLKTILEMLYFGDLDIEHSRLIGHEILNSKFAKKWINMDLVTRKLQYLELLGDKIEKDEFNLILNIIQMSPRSLLRLISIDENHISYNTHPDKNELLTNLVSDLGQEIIGGLPIKNPIKYKIELNFDPDIFLEPNIIEDDGHVIYKPQNYINEIKTGKNKIESIISREKANLVK